MLLDFAECSVQKPALSRIVHIFIDYHYVCITLTRCSLPVEREQARSDLLLRVSLSLSCVSTIIGMLFPPIPDAASMVGAISVS